MDPISSSTASGKEIIVGEQAPDMRTADFHEAEIQALPAIGSDHSPLVLRLYPGAKQLLNRPISQKN